MKNKHRHAPVALESPFGTQSHAFFSAKAVTTALSRFAFMGGTTDILLLRFYRTVENPDKIVIGSFVGASKSAISSIKDAVDMGEVYTTPVATLRTQDALKLFSESADKLTTEKIIEGAKLFESAEDVLRYLPPQPV